LGNALGKSKSTISEILSLNNLPPAVKDDCRNDPKTSRSVLLAIAGKKTTIKMTNLYTKYKENGMLRGEILTRTHKPKPADAVTDLSFVDLFCKKFTSLEVATLSLEQVVPFKDQMVKLAELVDQKVKQLP
jgi:hypothetical protein